MDVDIDMDINAFSMANGVRSRSRQLVGDSVGLTEVEVFNDLFHLQNKGKRSGKVVSSVA